MSHQTGHSLKHKQQLLQRRSKATTSTTTWMTFSPAHTNEGATVLRILRTTWKELGMSLAMEGTSVAPHVSGNWNRHACKCSATACREAYVCQSSARTVVVEAVLHEEGAGVAHWYVTACLPCGETGRSFLPHMINLLSILRRPYHSVWLNKPFSHCLGTEEDVCDWMENNWGQFDTVSCTASNRGRGGARFDAKGPYGLVLRMGLHVDSNCVVDTAEVLHVHAESLCGVTWMYQHWNSFQYQIIRGNRWVCCLVTSSQCSQLEMESRDSWKELVSVEAYVTGIMFYEGRESLQPLLKVKLSRQMDNPHDCNAIKVLVAREQQLRS